VSGQVLGLLFFIPLVILVYLNEKFGFKVIDVISPSITDLIKVKMSNKKYIITYTQTNKVKIETKLIQKSPAFEQRTDEEYYTELEKSKKKLKKLINKVRKELVEYRHTFNGL